MMRLENISSIFALVVVALLCSNLWVAEAKPGIAGAAWTKDEVNIAKAKIWEVCRKNIGIISFLVISISCDNKIESISQSQI